MFINTGFLEYINMMTYFGIEEGDLDIAFSSVQAFSKSHIQNEDKAKSWLALPAFTPKIESGEKGVLVAVADGMGGQGPKGAGRKASEIAINSFAHYYQTKFPEVYSSQNILEDLLVKAHNNIKKEGLLDPEKFKDMGATAAVALILKRSDSFSDDSRDLYDIHSSNVGDSRIYFAKKSLDLSNPENPIISYFIEQLSHDDIPKKDITRNMLLQSLGMNGMVTPNYNYAAKASSGDYLILCTDGVYKPMRLPEKTLINTIESSADSREIVDKLKKIHSHSGKKDDFGIVVVQIV